MKQELLFKKGTLNDIAKELVRCENFGRALGKASQLTRKKNTSYEESVSYRIASWANPQNGQIGWSSPHQRDLYEDSLLPFGRRTGNKYFWMDCHIHPTKDVGDLQGRLYPTGYLDTEPIDIRSDTGTRTLMPTLGLASFASETRGYVSLFRHLSERRFTLEIDRAWEKLTMDIADVSLDAKHVQGTPVDITRQIAVPGFLETCLLSYDVNSDGVASCYLEGVS